MKDSLSAVVAAEVMKQAIGEVYPGAEIECCPLSDGGEGLIEVLLNAGLGEEIYAEVEDPLGRSISARMLKVNSHTFILEMAQAAGLELLSPSERNPMHTSTRGVGLMILEALRLGAKEIYIGLGGSATHDLGCGMAHALGYRFYNVYGNEVVPDGQNLKDIVLIDFINVKDVSEIIFFGITDVQSTLLGLHGAAYTYAKQKGASDTGIERLEKGSHQLVRVLKSVQKETFENTIGSGAAGGLGFGLVTFLGATLLKGLEVVGQFTSLDEKLMHADLIITLEGKTDAQTLEGKLPYSIALKAKQYGKPVILYTGSWDRNLSSPMKGVFDAVIPIQDKPMSVEESIADVVVLLRNAVLRSFELMKIKDSLHKN